MPEIHYWRASDAEEIADQLMARCGEFTGLELYRIWYVHRTGDMPGQGCNILANPRKLPALQSALVAGLSPTAGGIMSVPVPQYVILISHDAWEVMREHDRHALIHHELSHIDPIHGTLRGHTAEDFATTARRFGAWSHGLQSLIDNAAEYDRTGGPFDPAALALREMGVRIEGEGPIADAMKQALGQEDDNG